MTSKLATISPKKRSTRENPKQVGAQRCYVRLNLSGGESAVFSSEHCWCCVLFPGCLQ
jgi:hypothetical protein